jgi:hypothetical protein
MFTLIRGLSILTVGPVGYSLIKLSPEVRPDSYGLGKYKVRIWIVSFFATLVLTVKLVSYHLLRSDVARQRLITAREGIILE